MASSLVFFGSLDANEPQSISFAPNMTEASFTSPEEPEFAETNALLFPPADSDATDDSSLSFKRPNQTKKKDAHIPRPPNAFILFRSSFIKQQHIPGSIEGNHSQLSKIVGACWQRLSYEERQVWERKAKEARAEHKRLYPNYRFIRSKNPVPKPTPKENAPAKFVNTMPVIGSSSAGGKTTVTTTQTPTKSRRRNNRLDEDPRRCEQIAKLLVAGHKGSSLEAMMKKFDEENSVRQKQDGTTTPTSLLPELPAKRSSAAREIARRSSSCPPLDIAAAELFRMDGPKSMSGPIRRPKPLRAAATLPYPPTFKSSRSVSPPISPSYLDAVNTPIEGPFANSTYTFNSATPNFIPRPESIAPKDAGLFSQFTSPTELEPLNYSWPLQPLSNENTLFIPAPNCGLATQTPMLTVKTQDGHVSDSGWTSEFEWLPTEDDAGASTGPPSTPGAPSPVIGFTRSLPLEEVAAQVQYSVDNQVAGNDIMDLSEYAKGLQLFSHDTFVSNHFTIPSVNINDLTPMNTNFDQPSDPSSFWQLQNIIDGIPTGVEDGMHEYHY